MSLKEKDAPAESTRLAAMYKGLKVAAYMVDKTEICLTRQDLIELINVCSLLVVYCLSLAVDIYTSTCRITQVVLQHVVDGNFRHKGCLKSSINQSINLFCHTQTQLAVISIANIYLSLIHI